MKYVLKCFFFYGIRKLVCKRNIYADSLILLWNIYVYYIVNVCETSQYLCCLTRSAVEHICMLYKKYIWDIYKL